MRGDKAGEVADRQREIIDQLMERTGMAMSSLATAAGIAPSTVTRAVKARKPLKAETMAKLSAISPEHGEGPIDRAALISALTLVHEALGLPTSRARAAAIAGASLYRRVADQDSFASPDEARRAATLAIETAEALLEA